ncbi:potassium channel family protein [Halosegnis sp.]|uniref:potassium channel family protein n=1 Tax=Halosegnis sp. TaxID=2864959 RepID=UPI0035D45468
MAQRLRDRPLLGRVLAPATAFVVVAGGGIAAFVLLADVGVIEAAFWLLDPTSLELHFAEHPEGPERVTKAVALIVFSGLIVASLWAGETVVTAAFGGVIGEELRDIRMTREIQQLDDHVVVCGFGMFGRTITQRLSEAGRDVVVVESNESELERLPESVPAVVGDARLEETLRDAGVQRADVLVAAIDDSNVNIQITIVAAGLSPECRIITRVGEEMYEATARRAGADEVIIPEVTSGTEVSELL